MRSTKFVIVLAVLLVALVGAYFLLSDRLNKSDDDKEESFYVKIMDVPLDQVKTVTVEQRDFRIVVGRNEENKWILLEPENIRYNSSTVSQIALSSYSVGSSKLIEENAQDLSKYGLDKPVVVTVETKDGSKSSFEIGKMAPTGNYYYIKPSGENNVYTLSVYTIEDILLSREDLIDKTLYEVEEQDVTALSMEKDGEKFFEVKRTGEASWQMLYPIDGKASGATLSEILAGLTGLTAADFVDLNPDSYGQYGLDRPRYLYEFTTSDGKNIKVLFGREDNTGKFIYAKLGDEPEVFTVNVTSVPFLDKRLMEVADRFVYITNIQEVDKITVDMDGYHLDIEIDTDPEDRDKDRFYVNGKDATFKDEREQQPFRKYYQALIGLVIDEIAPNETPQGEPEIVLNYTRNTDPYTMKVEFIPRDDKYYHVVRNGKYAGVLVRKTQFDKQEGVRDTYEKLMKGIEEYEKSKSNE